MSLALPSTECLNCGTAMSGPYCSECGQKSAPANPRFSDLRQEFTQELLDVDGRLWRSAVLLFTRPGWLTREYCAGRRAGYLSPLRLYLTMAVLVFAMAALVPRQLTVKQDARQGEVVQSGNVPISGELFLSHLTPAQVDERIQRAEHDWMPRLMLLLVPVWALLVMMVTRRARRHFPEHMVFALHAHAAFSGGLVLLHLARLSQLSWLITTAGVAVVTYIFWYTVTALRAVYGGGWVLDAGRALLVTMIYLVVVLVAAMALLAVALLL